MVDPVARQRREPDQLRCLRIDARSPLAQPAQDRLIFTGSNLQYVPASVSRLKRRFPKDQAPLWHLPADAATSELTRDRQIIELGRVAAQRQFEAALS